MNKYKKIPLTQGKYTIVDSDMFEYLSQWKWYLSSTGYAVRNVYIGEPGSDNRKLVNISMHRVVASTPNGMVTDHVNGNRIDNRRSNLRVCNSSENISCSGMHSNNKSGYKGVSWSKEYRKWRAKLTKNRVQVYSRLFETAEDAALAYNAASLKYNGEFAYQNKVMV